MSEFEEAIKTNNSSWTAPPDLEVTESMKQAGVMVLSQYLNDPFAGAIVSRIFRAMRQAQTPSDGSLPA